jgi:Uridylate kinase
MNNKMPMVVFGNGPEGNVTKALFGDRIGTLVSLTAPDTVTVVP